MARLGWSGGEARLERGGNSGGAAWCGLGGAAGATWVVRRGKWLGQRDGARLRCCVGSDSGGAAQVERLK